MRGPLAAAAALVVLAYAANAFFNHTAPGLAVRQHGNAYVVGFFIPFGVILPALFLGRVTAVGLAPARWLGARLGGRDVWGSALALMAAAVLAAVPLSPVLREAGGLAEVHRLFALLLVASTAEVLIFLGVWGNTVQLAAGGPGRWRAGLLAVVASSLAFGFFHLTYPAPWNTVAKCLGLSIVWGVSLVFLLTRSLVAAIAFNNLMAVVGFAQNRLELPGTAAAGWFRASMVLGIFVVVFGLARRWPAVGRDDLRVMRTAR